MFVPSIVGATEKEANKVLTPLGLTLIISEKRFDEDISSGQIIESDPAGGGKVDAGARWPCRDHIGGGAGAHRASSGPARLTSSLVMISVDKGLRVGSLLRLVLEPLRQ